jgi:hypothetical protein
MTNEELKKKIAEARKMGIPEEVIRQRIGTMQNTGKISLSTPKSGSVPSYVNSKSKFEENPIIKFLFNAPARLGRGIGTLASNLTNPIGYTKDKETLDLQNRAEQMAQQAEAKGDYAGAERLRSTVASSQGVNTQIQQNRVMSNKEAGLDVLKGGVGTAAYFIPGGKAALGTKLLKGTAGGMMTGFGASETGQELPGIIGGGVLGGGLSAVGSALGWAGKKLGKDIIQASGTSQNAVVRKFGKTVQQLVTKYGKSPDELLGPITEKNRGGTFQIKMKEAEDIIQSTVETAGPNTRIDGKIVVDALKKELNIQKAGLDTETTNALKVIVKQAQDRFKNGITAKQALTILRQANSKFGKAMATSPTGSTAKVAQMIQAEAMRDTLKKMFPELKNALNTQSEIFTLRPIVEKARSLTLTDKGIDLSKFDLVKPGTWPGVQPLMDKAVSPLVKTAGAVIGSPITARGITNTLVSPQSAPVSTPETTSPLDSGTLPTPSGMSEIDSIMSQQEQAMPESGSGLTIDDFKRAYIEDIRTTGGKNIAKIKAMSEFLLPKEASGKAIPAGQVTAMADITSSISQMSDVTDLVDTYSDIMGPVAGRARTLNPFDEDAQAFQADMVLVAQMVGKALEGGVLRQEDTKKYLKILPQISDTPEIAKRKVENVKKRLQNKLDNTQKALKEAGYTSGGTITDINSLLPDIGSGLME